MGVAEVAPALMYFEPMHILVLDEAVMVAEELVSDHFSLTSSQWLKNPYEIRTLAQVEKWEYPGEAYAHLVRYSRPLREKQTGADSAVFYRVCLHDHNILMKTEGGRFEVLSPFLIYVMTHELVHIVRFALYDSHPSVSFGREEEEKRVDKVTREILRSARIKGMNWVFDNIPPA